MDQQTFADVREGLTEWPRKRALIQPHAISNGRLRSYLGTGARYLR